MDQVVLVNIIHQFSQQLHTFFGICNLKLVSRIAVCSELEIFGGSTSDPVFISLFIFSSYCKCTYCGV